MGAGVGFEPHDLQVMSLTSYRTAPSRDKYEVYITPKKWNGNIFFIFLKQRPDTLSHKANSLFIKQTRLLKRSLVTSSHK